jgi:hypothetical protein
MDADKDVIRLIDGLPYGLFQSLHILFIRLGYDAGNMTFFKDVLSEHELVLLKLREKSFLSYHIVIGINPGFRSNPF